MKAKITQIGIVEGGKLEGWKFDGWRNETVLLLSTEGVKNRLGYTLDELREISKGAQKKWFVNLPTEAYEFGFMWRCDCGSEIMGWSNTWIKQHFPHRKESEEKENMRERVNQVMGEIIKDVDKKTNDLIFAQTIEAREKYDDFGNLKTESNIALQIRFIKLTNALVMEVLEQNNEMLGAKPDELFAAVFDTDSGIEINVESVYFSNNCISLPNSKDDVRECFYWNVCFDRIKTALTEFADAGAFWDEEDEKPVQNVGEYRLQSMKGENAPGEFFAVSFFNFSRGAWDVPIIKNQYKGEAQGWVNRLNTTLANHFAVKYEPKPRPKFESEWKLISPREFEIADLPPFTEKFLNSPAYIHLVELEKVTLGATNKLNREQVDGVEIWEFVMRKL